MTVVSLVAWIVSLVIPTIGIIYQIVDSKARANHMKINATYVRSRVFDTFNYNGEIYMLLNRLWRIGPYVDYFIMLVSNRTHAGVLRPLDGILDFSKYQSELDKYPNLKIFTYYSDNADPSREASWDRTEKQSNYLLDCVKLFDPQPNDLIINSDVDEIPIVRHLEWIITYPPPHYYALRGKTFYHNYRQFQDEWYGPFVVRYGAINHSLWWYRTHQADHLLKGEQITHCSYCMPTLTQQSEKLKNNAHREFSGMPYIDINYIYAQVICFRNFVKKGFELYPVDASPQWVNVSDPRNKYLTTVGYYEDLDLLDWDKVLEYALCDVSRLNKLVYLPPEAPRRFRHRD